jgi:glycerol-3-phosphate dehydrogenase
MGMVGYVIEEEMPTTIDDVLARRLRALRLNARATLEAAPAVAELMAGIQKRDQAWVAAQLASFAPVAQSAMIASQAPAGTGAR